MGAKILVIGLDGATWDILTPLIEQGHMPNLGKLVEIGASGPLESTYPPISPTAWTSFMTGRNPAGHGIFSFTLKTPGTYYVKPATYSDILCPTIWDILSQHEKRVAAINIPMTYPPGKLNGIMVSGMGTPGKEYPYCYPPGLGQKLDKIADDYIIDINWLHYKDEQIDQFISEIRESTFKRYKVAAELLEGEAWDLFMVVFSETDRLQHRLWHAIENSGQAHSQDQKISKTQRKKIVKYYEELDQAIGKLWELNRDTGLTILMSDHGFGRFTKTVDLNNLLEDMGYLKYNKQENKQKKSMLRIAKAIAQKLGFRREHFVKMINRFTPFDPYRYLDMANRETQIIDWSQTKAFCYSVDGIYINLRGRERNGIVDAGREYKNLKEEITYNFLNVVDPESGNQIFHQIVQKEKLYKGEYLEGAPDLIITDYDRTYNCQFQLFTKQFQNSIFSSDPLRTGSHRMDGILVVYGKNVKSSAKIEDAKLIDVAPTILKGIGLSIPKDMDGRYWHEIFESDGEEDDNSRTSKTKVKISRRDRSQSDTIENEEILNRLKGLGYIE